MKLFLKGERCFSPKCAIEKRSYAPGQHGRRKSKVQGYGVQLREKQKVKRLYGVVERQFRRYFAEANRKKGVTGEQLLQMLERRLDSVIFRLGFASSRAQARQIINHGHVRVDGRRVNVSSFLVRAGQSVSLAPSMRENALVLAALDAARGRTLPPWLTLQAEQFQGSVVSLPRREDVTQPIQEQLIVELYSK
ncbi:MAG: 30S ribosomal protein S4 [Gemmataceae bacterium]|nr:30S ribosomal protein S4 [Gemmataceae bacterium]